MKSTFKTKITIKPVAELKEDKNKTPPIKHSHGVTRNETFKKDIAIALKEIEIPKKVENIEDATAENAFLMKYQNQFLSKRVQLPW